jgi:Ca2+-binding EF-hand superfamily protein
VTDAELEAAFKFLDKNNTGKLTLKDLRERLAAFYPAMPISELKFLMGDQKELSLADIRELLAESTITHFDPVLEAFKVYDPAGTGYADLSILQDIFTKLGFGELSREDINVVLETADTDKDGRVSLEDFRQMLSGMPVNKQRRGSAT